jgi:tRNA(His) 5'-end guanylyltransferase
MADSLGDRMKVYEFVTRSHLMKRTPVIIRLDGKSFHTWTKWCDRPFDTRLADYMAKTTEFLIENIQGAVFGFTQSDEISILLRDYDTYETSGWFEYNIQKLISVSASMATAKFNYFFRNGIEPHYYEPGKMATAPVTLAFFDARAFNLSKEEVNNYFLWRQQDIIRNCVQRLGQFHLGHGRIHGLPNTEVTQLLKKKGIDVAAVDKRFSHGVAYSKETGLDNNIPYFGMQPDYVNRHVYIEEKQNDR